MNAKEDNQVVHKNLDKKQILSTTMFVYRLVREKIEKM